MLASDLTHAIAELSDDDLDDLDDFQLDQHSASSHDTRPSSTLKIITASNNGHENENVPMITVQDCDDDQPSPPPSEKKPRADFPKARVVPTPRPPILSIQ